MAFIVKEVISREEEEEEYKSCCADNDHLSETDDLTMEYISDSFDEFSGRVYFKGVSISIAGKSGFSGIGIVIERWNNQPAIQVQKKLGFYVEETVAHLLALMDGILEALQNKILRVFAYTDSELIYNHFQQVSNEKFSDNSLQAALKERLIKLVGSLETFTLNLVPSSKVERSLRLAQVAIGVVSFLAEEHAVVECCSLCSEEKPSSMMFMLSCTHRFCSQCLHNYVDEKVKSTRIPIRCPEVSCNRCISMSACRSFLPINCYESLTSLSEISQKSNKFSCPFSNCSHLFDPSLSMSNLESSSSQSDDKCVECPSCQRFICLACRVPWHSSMNCEMFENLPLPERDAASRHVIHHDGQRPCQQCGRMAELAQGYNHMRCLCGNEFCYYCGADYMNSEQTCECAYRLVATSNTSIIPYQESVQWPWDSIAPFPLIMDSYSEEERSQLMLLQGFLAGGFTFCDLQLQDLPPSVCDDSRDDAIKDLHQLPWLETFVSIITDNYSDHYVQ